MPLVNQTVPLTTPSLSTIQLQVERKSTHSNRIKWIGVGSFGFILGITVATIANRLLIGNNDCPKIEPNNSTPAVTPPPIPPNPSVIDAVILDMDQRHKGKEGVLECVPLIWGFENDYAEKVIRHFNFGDVNSFHVHLCAVRRLSDEKRIKRDNIFYEWKICNSPLGDAPARGPGVNSGEDPLANLLEKIPAQCDQIRQQFPLKRLSEQGSFQEQFQRV